MGDDGTVTLHIDVLCVVVGVVEGVVVHLGAAAVRDWSEGRGQGLDWCSGDFIRVQSQAQRGLE